MPSRTKTGTNPLLLLPLLLLLLVPVMPVVLVVLFVARDAIHGRRMPLADAGISRLSWGVVFFVFMGED